jgi:hypothetical protein
MDKIKINRLYKEDDLTREGFRLHSKFSRSWWFTNVQTPPVELLRFEREQEIYLVYQRPDGVLCPVEYYNLKFSSNERSAMSISEILELRWE